MHGLFGISGFNPGHQQGYTGWTAVSSCDISALHLICSIGSVSICTGLCESDIKLIHPFFIKF